MGKKISHANLIEAANDLVDVALKFRRSQINFTYKSKNDAVTNFDIYLQKNIFRVLSVLDPGVPILSEESFCNFNDSEAVWIIDPLDGTSNYIQGLAPSAIALAKVIGSQVLASLVIDISSQNIYTAVRGKGAQFNCNQLVSTDSSIKLLGASSGYIKSGGIAPDGWNIRILGSQVLQLCLVARGVLSASVSHEAKAWDDVAGSLIITESGGQYAHQYEGECWATLAINELSLNSTAVCNPNSFVEIKKLVEQMTND